MKRWQKVKTKDGIKGRVVENKPDGFVLIREKGRTRDVSRASNTLTKLDDNWREEDDD